MSSSEPPLARYLWATDPTTASIPLGELVQGRYQVVAPQIWRDTQPELPPDVPQELPDETLPYLRLYPQRLHVPEVYGVCLLGDEPDAKSVMLLENVPIDADGDLYPAIMEAWPQASPVRQVYWLWQILQLWTPLSEEGVALSLLAAENIRVQGWRVWLRELLPERHRSREAEEQRSEEPSTLSLLTPDPLPPTLKQLGECWVEWTHSAAEPVAERLQEMAQQMRRGDLELEAIATQLNQLLLEQAAQLPIRVQVVGASDTGPQRSSNEDTCYPKLSDLADSTAVSNDKLIPYFSLVCDGIGGHEGGEVASQLALQTLKQLVRALLVEFAEQTELATPEVVNKQLEETIRIVNDLIASQNDSQGRESRQRMGTTLVMALQLPQKIRMPEGSELGNAHELYIAHVGDSRAYWITPDYCQQLTVDDDVATRDVRLGRSLHREALKRPESGALTQALGTRDAELIRPTIQRFIVEEDGLLLLCSDGLSDRGWVEKSWREYAKPVLKGKLFLEAAVQSWIELANEKNGHDNTSIVLTSYLLSPEPPILFEPRQAAAEVQTTRTHRLESELTAASRALLYDESGEVREEPMPVPAKRQKDWLAVLGVLVLLLVVGIAGYAAWLNFKPQESPLPQSQPESPK